MMPRKPVTIGHEQVNASTETNAVSPTLGRGAVSLKDLAKAGKAAEAGAEADHAHEAGHDLVPDPVPIDRVVEAEAVPVALRAAEDQAPKHRKVLVLLRVPKAGPKDSVGTRQRKLYAVHISRINVIPKSADISTMDLVGSTRRVTAKRAKTASSNRSTNLEPPLDAHQIDRNHPTRRGRKAKRTAKQRTARTRLLPEEGAQIRRAIKTKRITRNLLPGHPEVAAEEKARRRKIRKIMPRSLWRYLPW